ncbi:MAG: FecR domain-containing protein [Pseudomonadota bacterium]
MNNTAQSGVTAEACAWVAQLETGNMTPADLDAFREWINRSPRHGLEIKRVADLSADLNVLAELRDSLSQAAHEHRLSSVPGKKSVSLGWGLGLAAMSLIVIGVMFMQRSHNFSEPLQLYTEVGGYLEQQLDDGTVVQLNTNSRVIVTYSQDQRVVSLLKGEVLFEVARDKDRPFLVLAGGKRISALGTAFLVRLAEQHEVHLTVTEGRVQLAELATPDKGLLAADKNSSIDPSMQGDVNAEPIELSAGQRVVAPQSAAPQAIELVSVEAIRRTLSWQNGLLDFSDTPLSEVVREITRYSGRQVEIVDQELANLRFGGVFKTGETELLLEALEQSFNIEIETISDGTVLLRTSKTG